MGVYSEGHIDSIRRKIMDRRTLQWGVGKERQREGKNGREEREREKGQVPEFC